MGCIRFAIMVIVEWFAINLKSYQTCFNFMPIRIIVDFDFSEVMEKFTATLQFLRRSSYSSCSWVSGNQSVRMAVGISIIAVSLHKKVMNL